MKWQNLSSKIVYPFIVAPIHIALSLRHFITPFHIIHTNPSMEYAGQAIASKVSLLEPFKNKKEFLPHQLIKKESALNEKVQAAHHFMESYKLNFPIIAKPDKGYVGMGVKKINSANELKKYFKMVPVDCMLQEYADHDEEYGIFYYRHPHSKVGSVISLTHKVIPKVYGDGKSTVKELIGKSEEFASNKESAYKYCANLGYIPKKGEKVKTLIQASHTFGAKFVDANDYISVGLNKWINELCKDLKGVHFARFDMKLPEVNDLHTGRGAKIVEINGCLSEPLHMYDDRHSLWFGIKTMASFYSKVFCIAKINKKTNPQKVPYKIILKKYKELFKSEQQLKHMARVSL